MNRIAVRTIFFVLLEQDRLALHQTAATLNFLKGQVLFPDEVETLKNMLQLLRLEGTTNQVMKWNKLARQVEERENSCQ